MTAQRLDRVLTTYRIGDPDGRFPLYDPNGSALFPGRWNTAETPMIYTSEHYATAMLEKLVRSNGEIPPNQHDIEITIPNGISYEVFDPAFLPDWMDRDAQSARKYGARWHKERRSLILIVPSIVARIERNVLINPDHPEAPQVRHGLHHPVWWDQRLFSPAD